VSVVEARWLISEVRASNITKEHRHIAGWNGKRDYTLMCAMTPACY
jgi:hypothetical protein